MFRLIKILLFCLCTHSCANSLSYQEVSDRGLIWLTQQLSESEKDFEITPYYTEQKLKKLTFQCSKPILFELNSSSYYQSRVHLKAYCEHEPLTSLSYKIEIYRMIAILRYPLHKGESLQKDHLQGHRIDYIKAQKGLTLEQAQGLIGYQAKLDINKNSIVSISQWIKPQLIKQGQEITISFESSNLSISCKGKALQNGSLGDMIKIRNSSSGVVVYGKVIDSTTVLVS